ncbi:MAG: alpha/beta hydrolase [Phormidesmis sp.]
MLPTQNADQSMTRESDVLWLSVSPSLKCFDQRLLSQLAKVAPVRRWEYCQTPDEPCCIESVIETLHDYISHRVALEASSGQRDHKLHLLGHGVSGTVALLYARRYPQHVASLSLLSVSAMPAVNWQAHYYALRQLLPCSREIVLAQMARLMFGDRPIRFAKALSQLLVRDLDSHFTLHSLANRKKISPGGADVPLLVCNGQTDRLTSPNSLAHNSAQLEISWEEWLKPGDRSWLCPDGNYFFHFHHPAIVANRIADYWQQVSVTRTPSETSTARLQEISQPTTSPQPRKSQM